MVIVESHHFKSLKVPESKGGWGGKGEGRRQGEEWPKQCMYM
jgi:hypothetical protein